MRLGIIVLLSILLSGCENGPTKTGTILQTKEHLVNGYSWVAVVVEDETSHTQYTFDESEERFPFLHVGERVTYDEYGIESELQGN